MHVILAPYWMRILCAFKRYVKYHYRYIFIEDIGTNIQATQKSASPKPYLWNAWIKLVLSIEVFSNTSNTWGCPNMELTTL